MDYNVRVIIDGVTIDEYIPQADEQTEDSTPSITNVKLKDSTSLSGIDIGSCASNSLYFTLLNPYKESYDGSRVELFISRQNEIESIADEIAEEIGEETDTNEEVEEDILDTDIDEEESEEGEDVTEAEAEEYAEEEAEANANLYDAFEGEDATIPAAESTDEAEEEEWTSLGVFYVTDQKNTENGISFTCLDGFCKMSGDFTPTNVKTTLTAFCNDLKAQLLENCGIVMDDIGIDDSAYPEELEFKYPMTYRQAIGYVAGKLGGFATFGMDDTVGVDFYTSSDTILMMSDMISFSDNSAGSLTITGITCNRAYNTFKTDEITAGDGVGIYFINPFVNESDLDGMYDNFNGITYSGAKFSTLWNENIYAGRFCRIMTDDEYAQYVGMVNAISQNEGDVDTLKTLVTDIGKTVLITNQTIDFTGEATTSVDSILNSTQKTEAISESPTDAKFRNLYAEMIEAEYLTAKGGYIADLVTDNLKVGSINGTAITDGTIVAAALSNEAVMTLGGSKVYYQATQPTDAKAGDSWYKTVVEAGDEQILFVYDGETWQAKQLDAKLLQANTITANEIASNTITATEINMDSLQTKMARIGALNDKHVEIDSDSVDIKNGDNTIASFGEDSQIEGSMKFINDGLEHTGFFYIDGYLAQNTLFDRSVSGKTLRYDNLLNPDFVENRLCLYDGDNMTTPSDIKASALISGRFFAQHIDENDVDKQMVVGLSKDSRDARANYDDLITYQVDDEYKFILDQNGNIETDGTIKSGAITSSGDIDCTTLKRGGLSISSASTTANAFFYILESTITPVTISSGSTKTGTLSISASGYTCIGVIGWNMNNGSSGSGNSYAQVYRLYAGVNKDTTNIYYSVRASGGALSKCELNVRTLWVKQ